MPSMPLSLAEKASGMAIEAALPRVRARRVDQDGMLKFCRFYRRIGIAKLLMTGLPDGLFADLSRSAHAFLYFLEGKDDAAKATGKFEPFFDAVACSDDAAAAGIARLARPTRNEAKEYEEDFLYLSFVMRRFALRARPDELDPLLQAWEGLLQGESDLRFTYCRALRLGDRAACREALEAIAQERVLEVQKLLADDRMPVDDGPTTAKVSVELLALLRMAEIAGVDLEREYPLAPSVARRLERAKLPPPDDWTVIDSYRELA